MPPVADYAFYQQSYLGTVIPENAYENLRQQAQAVLARMKRHYRVQSTGPDAENMAICAMAETLYHAAQHRGGISAATAGSVSVRDEDSRSRRRALWMELYEQAGIYLDIYRGVDAV